MVSRLRLLSSVLIALLLLWVDISCTPAPSLEDASYESGMLDATSQKEASADTPGTNQDQGITDTSSTQDTSRSDSFAPREPLKPDTPAPTDTSEPDSSSAPDPSSPDLLGPDNQEPSTPEDSADTTEPQTPEPSNESGAPEEPASAEKSPSPDTSVAEEPTRTDPGKPDRSNPPEVRPPDSGPSLYTRKVVGTGKPLAALGKSGKLEYRRYANQGQSNKVHILPDFSYAGYRGGGVALPNVPTQLTLSPASGDSRARIQAAIDKVSQRKPDAKGFRGAVLLKKGTYYVSDTLRIRTSGVVLRGEGQGKNGTILIATKRSQHDLIQIAGSGKGLGEIRGTRVKITSAVVPVGSNEFEVATSGSYLVGDSIAVLRTPNQKWIDTLGMKKYGWTTSGYAIAHERKIVAIRGNKIVVNIPIVDTIETAYGGGSIYKTNLAGRIEECGVEDLRLVSQYSGKTDEKHAWTGVKLLRTTHSWVRRVTVQHFGYAAVGISSQSSFNTVEETAMIDPISQITGGRRYPFNVSGGVGNLFQRCFARGGRHNFVTGSRVTGPHVWLDCLAVTNYSDDGPHHRWATGLLFDNTSGKALNVQNRLSSGTGHGWAGAQTLFWNAVATTIICDAPKGAMNWAIGCVGKKSQGAWAPGEPYGWWESEGKLVKPRSLYLQQLADRLGTQAVKNITTPAQRVGRIWSRLSAWAGQGRLDQIKINGDPGCKTGIRSGSACCAKSCGTCGGSGCSKRPGGVSSCCTSAITASGRSCTTNKPPCTLP